VVFTAFSLATFTLGNLNSPTCLGGETCLSLGALQGDSFDLFMYAENKAGLE